jgi:hypothetical protein
VRVAKREPLHSYEKIIVIRAKTLLFKEGTEAHFDIHSDLSTSNDLLAMLTRAAHHVMCGHGYLHNDLDPIPTVAEDVLGPMEIEEDDEDGIT